MAFLTQDQLNKVQKTLDQSPLKASSFLVEHPQHPSLILTVKHVRKPEHRMVLFFGDGRTGTLEEILAAGPGKHQVCAELCPGANSEHERLVDIGFKVFLEELSSWAERVSRQPVTEA